MRATIRQVAARAKVSPMTVSRALSGRKHSLAPETYERVLEAVREMDYVPVRVAAQNRHIETRAIGVVPFHANLSHVMIDSFTQGGIYEGARKHGYDVLVMLRDEAEWMVNGKDVRFLDRRSDGFIFVSGGIDEWQNALELLSQHQIPTVVCYRRDVADGIAWVDPDNESIIEQALHCLWREGHRRIAYLGGPDIVPMIAATDPNWLVSTLGAHSNYDDMQRRRLFLAASDHQDWQHLSIHTATDVHWKIRPEIIDQLKDEGVTGVVCSSDYIALQFLALAEEKGVRVPQDFSVIGTDDLPGADAHGLTTIAFGYGEVGRLAVEAWIALLAGKPAEQCCHIVPTQLIERSSVSAPRI